MTGTPELTPELRLLEAIIFASGEPVTVDLLAAQLPGADVPAMLRQLKELYAPRGSIWLKPMGNGVSALRQILPRI